MKYTDRFSQGSKLNWHKGNSHILNDLNFLYFARGRGLKVALISSNSAKWLGRGGREWDYSGHLLERFHSETNTSVILMNAQSHAHMS